MYHIWVNYNDLTVLPKPGIMVNIIGESSPRQPDFSGEWIIMTLPRYIICIMRM